jgi:hypothetical protein
MNNGFFGFPSATSSTFLDIKEFDTSGYYSVPKNANSLLIFAVGGGGGGGSGRRGATSANAGGGGGGGGGSLIYLRYILDDVIIPGSQLNIVIGAGGSGGQLVIADNTNGNTGVAGGDTYIQVNNKAGYLLYAIGGNLGTAGGATGGAASSARGSVYFNKYGILHGAGGGAGNIGTKPSNYSIAVPRQSGTSWHGGGGGAGYTNTGTVAAAGTDIVAGTSTTISTINPIGYAKNAVVLAGGSSSGGNGTSSTFQISGKLSPGVGGAGGGGCNGSTSSAAGSGGNGYRGSGGGGGGGARIGFNSGTGGAGGNGYVCIIAFA